MGVRVGEETALLQLKKAATLCLVLGLTIHVDLSTILG